MVDSGHGVGPLANGVYLDFREAVERLGRAGIVERYENLFAMYERITGEDAFATPMRIYPAPHYTMGGLWVDYNLMTTVEGLYAIGEANFSDHGANRLGASALMQGLADGYFVLPYTIGDYLARGKLAPVGVNHTAFRDVEAQVAARVAKLLAVNGTRTVDEFHRDLGTLLWDRCGMSRTADGLSGAIERVRALRERFWREARAVGSGEDFSQSLEKAGRVADCREFAHDCREGICGACGMVINGRPHGPQRATTACQLHMRHFTDGQEVWIEPWRARAFPVVKDLVVDRSAFDRIIQAGGFITVRAGSAPEANTLLVPKRDADLAMDAAACIGCGACVAACPNASAMLFVAAKVSHLGVVH